jgi:diacylglycerol kinase
MTNLHSAVGALWLLQILVSAFLTILFLQSGIDKVVDRGGNLQWLTGHFANSPLRGTIPLLLIVITILELGAGFLSGLGCVLVILHRGSSIAFYGAILAAVSLLALFFGQRMAKDYAGAAVLVSYFLVTGAAIYLLAI